jgi:hypothetical protein
MHWMPRHTHTFSFSLKPILLLFGDSDVWYSMLEYVYGPSITRSLIPSRTNHSGMPVQSVDC